MLFRLCLLSLFALSTVNLHANICEAINSLSNEWNEVANFVHQFGDQPMSDEDLQVLEEYVTDLSTLTFELVNILQNEGNDIEVRLANGMAAAMKRIEVAQTQADSVAALDSLVAALDRAVDYCDEL